VKSEVITAITTKIFVFWDVIACGLVYLSRLHGVMNFTILIGVPVLLSEMQVLNLCQLFTTSNLQERVVSSCSVVRSSFLLRRK
jgi:hypothetical protein